MPSRYKFVLSILALVICCTVFYVDHVQGAGWEKWVPLLLGPVMVVSIWIFPEANAKDIRSESARRRS